jgi:hypothetical protein
MEEDIISFNPPAEAKTIDVNFDFLEARPEFDMSVRPFVAGLFDRVCPVVDLASAIANQPEVGTFLIADSGEKPENSIIGLATVLPVLPQAPFNYPFIYLGAKGDISLVNGKQTGFFFCERVLNMPVELIPHLYNQLLMDIQWAEANCEGRFNFEYFLTLSKCLSTLPPTGNARKKKKNLVPDNLIFFRVEDEFFLKRAEESFLFENEKGLSNDDTCSHKLVMILNKNAFVEAVQETIKSYSTSS